MKITRRFTKAGQDVYNSVEWDLRDSRIANPDGSVVFEMKNAEIPKSWSQLATDIMVSKYFRKAGVPQKDEAGNVLRDKEGNVITGPEKSARQVVHRLAGCWRHWGETHGYFDSADDAQAFYDELAYMLLHQMCAPNSPQWFNTGLNWAYGITGPAQGHYFCDPKTGALSKSKDAYSHPQPHACQPFHALVSTPKGPIPIGEIVTNKLVGLEVFDGSGDGAGTTRVKAVKSNGEKPVFRIVLKNGISIEATADHLVWAIDEHRPAGHWVRVDALQTGQRMQLSTVTSVSEPSEELTAVECGLVGWLQGDGFVGQYTEGTNQSLTLEFMTVDDDEHQFVLRGIARVFEGVHYKVRTVESQNPQLTIRRIRLYGEKLRPFVETYQLLREGEELAVPPAVLRAGSDAQRAYLSALFQTDGCVRLRDRGSRTSDFVLTTTSLPLARGVQALLLNHGIYSRVQQGTEKRSNRRVPYFVSIGYAQARSAFRERINFISTNKRNKAEVACGSEFPGKDLPALRQELIQRIELVGTQPVYDIQTESGQYLSNNVVVHNCFIQSVNDDLVNPGGIMDLWTREARLFKYGSGTGSNFSKLRGEDEPLSGGGKSSGLMSFLRIGDRAAGAIKSGGTTRRAAKMVCLDLDHPDIEQFVNWKVREELKVAAMVEGLKVLPAAQRELAEKLGLRLNYDFNGEAYYTVSGQNSNNSVRIPNRFFKALEEDGDWELTRRTDGKVAKRIKARELWDQIAFAAWRCADPGVQYDDTINQWHTCPKSGRINASNPCVTGDTRVLHPGGIWRRIDQMIHLPARIVTNKDGQEIHVTDGAFPTGTRPVFELRTQGGYAITLTADHKVLTKSRGWVPAAELTTTDEVRLPSQPACADSIGEPLDSRLFQLAGLLMSDSNGDTTSLQLEKCVESPALESLHDYLADNWKSARADDSESTGGIATLPLTNRRLISRLRAFIRIDDGGIRLSDEAFTAGLAAQKHILRGLFTADGIVTGDTIELRSGSEGLLRDVQLLLLGFGIKSSRSDHATRRQHDEDRSAAGDFKSATDLPDGGAVDFGGMPGRRVFPTPPGSRSTAEAIEPQRGDADFRRHGLRIDPGSLHLFCTHIAVLPGEKLERLADAVAIINERHSRRGEAVDANFDRVAAFEPRGVEPVYDLTEPITSSFVANGLTVHNCSEYMFLDDTACNLASLNVLTFFDAEARRFDIDGFRHAIRLWTIVLEISVLMASFPSEEIARLSYRFRTLGLGYANLGAMLMQAGIPYDSEKARAICGALTAILTGESYAASAEMAKELGAFPGYAENKADMLRVMKNHRRAAYDIANQPQARKTLGDYAELDIKPVGIDASQFTAGDTLATPALIAAAQQAWDRAVQLGERHGYRNAQTTVIAPTGTIGLLMDCDTTGVEPDFALVKFKKLAGGGYFKIANQSIRPALVNLGYSPDQIADILKHVMGTLTLQDAPHVNWATLKLQGFTDADLEKIERSLPSTFELSFAFSPWSLDPELFKRLNITEAVWQAPGFNLLRHLGYTRQQIDQANDVICGRGTVEGAPHLKEEHLPVFDCANRCGKHGQRYIHVDGHIRMMAAAQPFISGAISKTINLPNEATVEDIERAYELSWKLGLKANALYRDGSKLSQPLNVKSDEELDKSQEDDDENIAAAKDELAVDVAKALTTVSELSGQPSAPGGRPDGANVEPLEPVHTHIIEKIVERIVERPLRRRLPDTRHAVTHKFDIAGHEGYLTVGLYDDGQPGELFITMAKEGSTIGGLMDTIATLVSVSLQYGVPVESLVRKFEHVRFEPSGMTRNSDIPFAKSLVDYIFRWMAMQFVPGYRAANAPQREPVRDEESVGEGLLTEQIRSDRVEGLRPFDASSPSPQRGEGPGGEASRRGEGSRRTTESMASRAATKTASRLTPHLDPVSQQAAGMQSDAPPCGVCGSITVRSGTCYKCQNCGNSMGCS